MAKWNWSRLILKEISESVVLSEIEYRVIKLKTIKLSFNMV